MANEPNYSSNPSKDEPKKEKVRVIPLEYIDEVPMKNTSGRCPSDLPTDPFLISRESEYS